MLKEVFRLLPKVTAVWLVLFIVTGASGVYLNQPFDFLSPFWVGFIWLVGFGLLLGLLVGLLQPEGRFLRVACLIMVSAVLPTFYFYGDDISFGGYFYWHKSQYEAVIARVSSAAECPPLNSDNAGWDVDCGPPRRIAFPMPGGIIDNWVGVVYDPTGLVMEVNQVDLKDLKNPKFAHVVGLFGGDMIYARHLFGHWYMCSFT